MEGPPLKKQRRTDSAAMWDHNVASKSNDDPKPRSHQHASREISTHDPKTEHRSQRINSRELSQKRDHSERSKDRLSGRNGGKNVDIHRSRQDHQSERRGARSRSPVRVDDLARTSKRERSPVRRRRHEGSRERTEHRVNRDGQRPKESDYEDRSKQSHRNGNIDKEMDWQDTSETLETQMQKIMGFGSFRSTKNTKVPGNDRLYGVYKEKKAEYRQYMNRVGGFNRPLSPG